jgi:Predicted phosphoesterases, related to the Icc protein
MKILAFSDWRIQPFEMITDIVTDHKPDVILYAGDDLDRFVRLDKSLLLKTSSHLLKLNYPDLEPVLGKQNKLFTQKFKKNIQEIDFQSNDILQKLGIPFYYVNGNDDFVLHADSTYYTRIHNGYLFINGKCYTITETPKGRITIKEMDDLSFLFPKESEPNPNEDLKTDVTSAIGGGMYAPISPSFGKFTIQNKSEEITIFGSGCEFGLKSKIKNEPKEYADIYLSHLPPLGTLDLSVRFGINHIGSKKLLDAVKKYHPRLVICGHSHIWGGISGNIGETLVINVSSQDRDPSYGNYALINTDDWSIEMKTIEEKIMRTIRGLRTIRSKLNRKRMDVMINKNRKYGVDIDETLRNLSPWKLRCIRSPEELYKTMEKIEKLGVGTKRIKERFESLTWKEPKIIRKITINPDKHAFVDVETGLANGPEPGKLWLIGLWYDGDLRQFLFPKEKKEFLKYLKQNQITSLVSWTGYDRNALCPLLERTSIDIKFIDACQRTSNCVIWYTYRLHELYNALFPDKNDIVDLIPGHIAGLYADHLIISNKSCLYCPQKEVIIDQIKERNKVDILQMIEICRLLWRKDGGKECNAAIKDLTQADVDVTVENYRTAMLNRYGEKLDKSRIEKMVKNYRQALLKRVKNGY